MNTEVWLPVMDFESLYEVSDLGRARSLDRSQINVLGIERRLRGRILKATPSPDGYPTVSLSRENRTYYRSLHRMVLESFVGPRPEAMVGRHLNGDPSDNRLCNLAYGTFSENALDMIAHGRCPQLNKTECKRGHKLEGWTVIQLKSGRRCRRCEYERMGVPWTGFRQRPSRKPLAELGGLA